jgi:alkanesulfonate monooxygenase SsuD/methylene tetrahydromethanopterin reductase-like flavin-dependent oxidoreductase (luciferase family)
VALEFGIFDHQERRRDVPLDQQYRERLAWVAQADRAGFYGYHLAEHHGSRLCVAPSQNVFFGAMAQATSRIRFGPLVYLLPFHHPLRLIEEIAMIDNLSDGRFFVGVGKGISPLEHVFWGHPAEEAVPRFEETLAIVARGLTSDRLSYEGRFYQFHDVPMLLKPKQQPYPPFWYAGNVEHAAHYGMNFIGGGSLKNLPVTAGRYTELWEAGREGPNRLNQHITEPKFGSVRHMYVAETELEAERVGRRAWAAYHSNFPKPGYANEAPPGTGGPSLGGDFDLACRVEAALVGTPSGIRDYVGAYAETGMNYFVGAFQWGDITHEEATRSLALFADGVMREFGTVS